ncbi:MAG TPA: glycosyltransferase family 2 protein [Spirochaetota bacterium]|nr:glycosyltransferase family 2 protein [Spirochaetota bacterium]HOL57135.1 glycosyltransferase family 2 protein [Spirochaetota bacterium]HPP05079.1 glycosyltransferase family 2 protein [Spirochaetota bacterium]
MKDIKFSIITVVYNGESSIENTILSVINQSYKNIEYIIIDGKSTDKTLQIVNKYSDKITKIVSEKDNGLYYAMNKGIDFSTGDYLWFINSGDEIYENETIEKISAQIEFDLPDVIYGRTALYGFNGEFVKTPSVPQKINPITFAKGMLVSHQGFIVSKRIVEYYDTEYKSASDQDWIIRILKKSKTILNTNEIISKYIIGGSSYKNFILNWKERLKIIKKHFNLYYYIRNIISFIINYAKFLIKQKIFKKDYIFKEKKYKS